MNATLLPISMLPPNIVSPASEKVLEQFIALSEDEQFEFDLGRAELHPDNPAFQTPPMTRGEFLAMLKRRSDDFDAGLEPGSTWADVDARSQWILQGG